MPTSRRWSIPRQLAHVAVTRLNAALKLHRTGTLKLGRVASVALLQVEDAMVVLDTAPGLVRRGNGWEDLTQSAAAHWTPTPCFRGPEEKVPSTKRPLSVQMGSAERPTMDTVERTAFYSAGGGTGTEDWLAAVTERHICY